MNLGPSAPAGYRDRLLDVLPTDLTDAERRVAVTLYRLLAEGAPVEPETLAAAAGVPIGAVTEALSSWHGVYRDEARRVIGFWGLAIPDMAHRLDVDGRRLSTWCAWDTLFIPAILGRTARVESPCPVTGETVRLVVSAAAVESVEPGSTVVSFLELEEDAMADIQTNFCHFIHFFTSQEAGLRWTQDHPGTFLVTLEEAFELGAAKNRAQFRDLLVP